MLENVHYNAKNTYFCTLNKESNTFNVNTLPKIESKALVDDAADNTIKESAKEELNNSNSNINYEQQINSWLKNMTNKKFF